MTTTTTTAAALAELRERLQAAELAHPELRRELRQALVGIDRRLGLPASEPRRDRRGVHGLRTGTSEEERWRHE